ncbi:MAG: energy transducer TonB [Rhodoferax sp.]|nr:energy transducer TonB [Rhodoferax sp.]
MAAPVAAPPVRVAANLQASGTCQKPEYPALSRRREEQGSVMLKLLIGVNGNVLESQIEHSSGFARLDEAARAALAKCQFKAGTIDGKPEPSWASMKYTWRLD